MISIIILNFNTCELLQRCLAHLSDLRTRCEVEKIVVDNASSDGSQEWLQSHEEVADRVILLEANLGFAGGCNAGIRQAVGDYVLLLNTDAFPQHWALDALVDYADQNPRVGVVGPQLLFPNGQWQRSSGLVPSPTTAMLDALGVTSAGHVLQALSWPLMRRFARPRRVGYVDGACMLIRREVIGDVGLLDETLFFSVEDAEFCHRARANGWDVVLAPGSRVVHLRGGSSIQKNRFEALAIRVRTEKQFIVTSWGEKGWRRYRFWRRLNFWWRYSVCSLVKRGDSCRQYEDALQAYRKHA